MMRPSRSLLASLLALAWAAAPGAPLRAQQPALTARQVVERIERTLGGEWPDDGIDAFKDGDPDTRVTGIAVTMMATMDVLRRAAASGRNLVITHEPTFYGHQDRLADLEREGDAVTAEKRAFIREHRLVVWRLHDHWHAPLREPDGVTAGMLRALGWDRYQRTPGENPVVLPETTVAALASRLRERLGARALRVVGDSTMRVTRVAFLPGFAGFAAQRHMLQRPDVELLVMGEAHEWETIAWAADAATQGRRKALIVLGHTPSEQGGSEELARWLRPLVPEVPVELVPAADPFWMPE
ncbi:MAG TPA: Nif3-like dinuclear metal center hexameric protein [Gemmatimonadaceae bacterium]|nr:Nif3-like dinuclear metal center hexameric protein [Gemmatimonadaceae bacterium]